MREKGGEAERERNSREKEWEEESSRKRETVQCKRGEAREKEREEGREASDGETGNVQQPLKLERQEE